MSGTWDEEAQVSALLARAAERRRAAGPALLATAARVTVDGPRDAEEARRLLADPEAVRLLGLVWADECPPSALTALAAGGTDAYATAVAELLRRAHADQCATCGPALRAAEGRWVVDLPREALAVRDDGPRTAGELRLPWLREVGVHPRATWSLEQDELVLRLAVVDRSLLPPLEVARTSAAGGSEVFVPLEPAEHDQLVARLPAGAALQEAPQLIVRRQQEAGGAP